MAGSDPNEVKRRFQLASGKDVKRCPFNQSHVIPSEGFLAHIIKCEEIYRKECAKEGLPMNMAHCRHNYAHVWPRDQIGFHENRCGDKPRLDPNLGFSQNETTSRTSTSHYMVSSRVHSARLNHFLEILDKEDEEERKVTASSKSSTRLAPDSPKSSDEE